MPFDQFGPLSIRPCHGTCWAPRTRPARPPITAPTASGTSTAVTASPPTNSGASCANAKAPTTRWPAFKTIRAARPDTAPIYVICDNLSANKTPAIRTWARRHKVELCLTPTNASWANPIEPQFGPLRTFTMAGSNPANHPALTRDLQAYLRWRNAHARHPDVLAAQRRERARIRGERQQRWGRPPPESRVMP